MTLKDAASGAPDPTTVVSLTEAARRVGVSRRTLSRAIARGQLSTQPAGGVALADLAAFGYELGPGGRSGLLAVRLLDELQAAHARERELLRAQAQVHQAAQQALAAQLTAALDALHTLSQQLQAAAAPPTPANAPEAPEAPPAAPLLHAVAPDDEAPAALAPAARPPGGRHRVAFAGLTAALGVLL